MGEEKWKDNIEKAGDHDDGEIIYGMRVVVELEDYCSHFL